MILCRHSIYVYIDRTIRACVCVCVGAHFVISIGTMVAAILSVVGVRKQSVRWKMSKKTLSTIQDIFHFEHFELYSGSTNPSTLRSGGRYIIASVRTI